MDMRNRLIVMNFLQFAVWGAYLTSMGRYLGGAGLGDVIGWFYAMQGIVSLFMPAVMGIVADRWVPAQRLLGYCHLLSGLLMIAAGVYGLASGITGVEFAPLFALYSLSVAFYMPTLGLANSVAYTALDRVHLDSVKAFPPIRTFGTIGFICSMWVVDLTGFQDTAMQFVVSGLLGLLLFAYSFTLPPCPVTSGGRSKSLAEALGLKAFTLFKRRKIALFFIFSVLLGASLQITNGYANPFLDSFKSVPEYADTFGVQHSNILISLSQASEALCILMIPFFLKRYGIKTVMLIAMVAWVLRFGLFGLGDPGDGVWMFVLSMLVYGVAFDFFNISGSLFIDKETTTSMRSSAQGIFILMTNGVGATVGTLGAQAVVNSYIDMDSSLPQNEQWSHVWFIFAAYALVVAIAFAVLFRYKHDRTPVKQ
ncbi:MAG TPA: MFS transporter [Candidatus Avibacteroides avistercoris]|uniref:MFS transporter n=1 Tax=Candidatus Avibacteroides avistercoris TaxID=2840690 RepID=A0A9D2ZUU0_9BACT|nr:MFS transporter [Candidatus Avibacteroides avistercoris]